MGPCYEKNYNNFYWWNDIYEKRTLGYTNDLSEIKEIFEKHYY